MENKNMDNENLSVTEIDMLIPSLYRNVQDNDIPDCFDINQSFYLSGGVGTGKTHTLWAIFRHKYITAPLRGEFMIRDWRSIPDIINWTKQVKTYCNEEFKYKQKIINDLCNNFRPLYIDDIGAEILSDTAEEFLYIITNSRAENNLITSFTANKKLSELAYDIRIISRIAGIVNKNRLDYNGFSPNDKRIAK